MPEMIIPKPLTPIKKAGFTTKAKIIDLPIIPGYFVDKASINAGLEGLQKKHDEGNFTRSCHSSDIAHADPRRGVFADYGNEPPTRDFGIEEGKFSYQAVRDKFKRDGYGFSTIARNQFDTRTFTNAHTGFLEANHGGDYSRYESRGCRHTKTAIKRHGNMNEFKKNVKVQSLKQLYIEAINFEKELAKLHEAHQLDTRRGVEAIPVNVLAEQLDQFFLRIKFDPNESFEFSSTSDYEPLFMTPRVSQRH